MPINKTKNTNLKKKVSNIEVNNMGMKDSLLQNSYLSDDELRVCNKHKLSSSNIQWYILGNTGKIGRGIFEKNF